MKYACWNTRLFGAIHGHIGAGFQMAHRQLGLKQGVLECERAAQQKGDQVIAPPAVQIHRFVRQHSVLINAIPRQVSAEIRTRGHLFRLGIAGFGNFQQWARFGIALAKEKKIKRQVTGNHDEVGLNVAEGQAWRRPSQVTGAGKPANLS